MKIGMVFECGPQGAEMAVCTSLARRILHNVDNLEIETATLDNKPKLIDECGGHVAELLAHGCERVLIIWDLYPAWRIKKQRPCRHEDKEAIRQSLANAGVTSQNVFLVCIQEELEAWLIADGRAISRVLSTRAHPVEVDDVRHPDRERNPKKRLGRIFKTRRGPRYNDLIHAGQIAVAIPDISRLSRSETFVRFAEKVSGKAFAQVTFR